MDAPRPAILVVDDDPDILELLRHHLSGAGYDVALAEGAQAAGERMLERVPDLIVADINMPRVSGVEFVAGLKKDTALAAIPVIYLTALEENTELAVQTLGFPLLAKPVAAQELLALVARQLRLSAKDR